MKKIKRLPYNKTYRREQQLQMEAAEKLLARGRLRNRIFFCGVVVIVLLAVVGIVALTTFIPDIVYSYLGAER